MCVNTYLNTRSLDNVAYLRNSRGFPLAMIMPLTYNSDGLVTIIFVLGL